MRMNIRFPHYAFLRKNQDSLCTVILKPFFSYEAAIADNGYTWEEQIFLAVANQFSNKFPFLLNKRLTTTEVNLLHAYYIVISEPVIEWYND